MQNKKNFNFSKLFLFYFILYLTLLLSLFFQENTTGGAAYDFKIISKVIINFANDLKNSYKDFYYLSISHFPYYYIFLSFFYNDYFNFLLIKIVILHLSLFLPFVFFKIIKLKYDGINNYLILIPGIFFLSPSFRTSAAWGFNDNIALIFFSLSIFYFIKFFNTKIIKKKNIFLILNIFFLALASYVRQYYAIFIVFYLYKIYQQKQFRILLLYIFFAIIFSLQAIIDTFVNNFTYSFNFIQVNIINSFLIFLTIFIIYLIPIYFEKKNILNLIKFYKENKIILLILFFIVIFSYYFFDYGRVDENTLLNYGGGYVYNVLNILKLKYLFFPAAYISFLIIFHFTYLNFKNNFLITIILTVFIPLPVLYQKYFDPLSLILIFCLYENNLINNFINNLKTNIKFLYLYFVTIYLGTLFYYTLLGNTL